MKVDAVGVVTKTGNTLLCDRVSGKPLFPFRLRRAPAFTLPGDTGAALPARRGVAAAVLPADGVQEPMRSRIFLPGAHDAMMKLVNQSNLGWFVPFQLNKTSIFYGILGGAEWPGAAADPKGRMFVTSNNIPFLEGVTSTQKERARQRQPFSPRKAGTQNIRAKLQRLPRGGP